MFAGFSYSLASYSLYEIWFGDYEDLSVLTVKLAKDSKSTRCQLVY